MEATMWVSSCRALLVALNGSVDNPGFNAVHASAAFSKLAKFKRQRQLKQEDP